MKEKLQNLKNQIIRFPNREISTPDEKSEIEQFQLAAIVKSSQDAIYSTDFNGTILSWNDGAEKIFGYAAHEVIGQNISMLFLPEDCYREINILKRIKRGGYIESYETIRIKKDGFRVPISLTVSPIRNNENHIIGVSRIARDLTESQRTKKRLRENNNLINSQLSEIEAIYRTAPVGLSYLDEKLRYVRLNDRMAEFHDLPAEKLVGRTLNEVLPDYILNVVEPICRSVLTTGEPVLDMEVTGESIVRFGVKRTWIISCYPLNNQAGETIGVNSVVQEITERKRQENEIKRAAERAEIAQEAARAMLYEFLPQTGEAIRSESLNTLTGYALGEIPATGAGWKLMIHPDDRAAAWNEIKKGIADGSGFSLEYRVRHKDAHYIWIFDRARVFFGAHGEVERVVGMIVDITERKQTEEKLLLSKQRLRGLIDNLFSFVGLLSLDGTVVEANRTALVASNVKPEDVIGKKFPDTVWWTWSEDVQEQLREAIVRAAQGETIRYDVIIKVGEDKLLPFDFQLAPMFDESGAVINLVPSGIDISERLRLEAKLKQTAQIALAGELTAGLAHEIKNPLTGIQGAIDILIQRRRQDDEERPILENVRREVVRIDDAVRSLLNRTRPRLLTFANTSLKETVRRAVRLANHQLAARQLKNRIKIESHLPKENFLMAHDAAQIEDAVLNLILNAMDAIGEESGQIGVRLYKKPSAAAQIPEAVIEVVDTGCGISETELSNLFTPFYTTKETGTGLGLVAVKRIAKSHEGYCKLVESAVGQGSTFALYLPTNSYP